MSLRDPRAVLDRALARLQARAATLEQRLDEGEDVWTAYGETVATLAVVAPRLEPGARNERRDPPRPD